MHIFYIPEIKEETINLNSEESRHAVRVLRLKKGEMVQAVDGRGGFYTAEIINADPVSCKLKIISQQKDLEKKDFYLHIAIAPTKNIDRFEWFIEKTTEIGIDEITPLLTDHSERKNIKNDRLQKIAVAAMKQSGRAYMPVINPIISFSEFVLKCNQKSKFIAHCHAKTKQHLKNLPEDSKDICIIIGPEGDFSPDEVIKANNNGFKSVTLGTHRLRTETAGIVACTIVNIVKELSP